MENLTKENFWNEMKEKYPKAMEKFCTWIDEYKKKNDWDYIFAFHIYGEEEERSPKYHELPLAFQIGIFSEFVHSYSLEYEGEESTFIDEVKGMMISFFTDVEPTLNG